MSVSEPRRAAERLQQARADVKVRLAELNAQIDAEMAQIEERRAGLKVLTEERRGLEAELGPDLRPGAVVLQPQGIESGEAIRGS